MIWSRPDLRVLFVCTANVCRSPLAEGLLRHRLRAMRLASRVQVRSAGTSVGQRGRSPDPRVKKLAARAGVSLAGIRARMLTPEMVNASDCVLVMEHRHQDQVAHLCASGDTNEGRKWPDHVQLLGNFLPIGSTHLKDIPDPYFGNQKSFDELYSLIDAAVQGLLVSIQTRLEDFR